MVKINRARMKALHKCQYIMLFVTSLACSSSDEVEPTPEPEAEPVVSVMDI